MKGDQRKITQQYLVHEKIRQGEKNLLSRNALGEDTEHEKKNNVFEELMME